MPEIWKDVPGCKGYQVSSLGRVRTLDRMVVGSDGREELHHGKILKPQRMKNRYLEVYVCVDGRRKHRTVHSLVAEAFLGERPDGTDVMHLNGDRSDNRVENLTYGPRAENLHSTYYYGGKQANGKLSLEDVEDIRRRLVRGESATAIARDYRVNISTICHVRDRKSFAWYEGGVGDVRNTCVALAQ